MFKKLYTLIGCLGAFSSALYPGWAFSTCEFKEQSDLSYQLEIESIEDYQEHTTDYAKGARQCTVSFRIKVDGQWFIASGDYVYGNKLSDSDGCAVAEERAKQDILRVVSPEIMTGSKELVCHNEVNTNKIEPTVDLFTEISDSKVSENSCQRIYHEVILDNSVGQVWECADE